MAHYSNPRASSADNVLRVAVSLLGVPVLILLVTLMNILVLIYSVDLVFAGWLLAVIFLGPMLLTVVWWGAALCWVPLGIALADEASTSARVLGLALTPVGAVAGFLLWQLQNAIIYGVIDADPEAYNWVFDRIGLGI